VTGDELRTRLAAIVAAAQPGRIVHGTELSDMQNRSCNWIFCANRVGNDGPYVGMRLDQERHAFDGPCVRALAALRQTLLDQRANIREKCDSAARVTLSAKVIAQPLAIGRLREHSREREFAHAARTREEHGVWHVLGGEHTAERGEDARVAEKFSKAHGNPFQFSIRLDR